MAAKKGEQTASKRRMKPAMTPEARENQLISMAYDLAEERMANKTATSAEIVHLLKQGSMKMREEIEKLKKENDFLKAKTEVLESSKMAEEMYVNAMEAMKTYTGSNER